MRSGAPTSAFMDAARKWNSATFTDPSTGTVHSTVDLLSADDMISIIAFDAPYSPQSDNRPWDDAEYETTVEFEK